MNFHCFPTQNARPCLENGSMWVPELIHNFTSLTPNGTGTSKGRNMERDI